MVLEAPGQRVVVGGTILVLHALLLIGLGMAGPHFNGETNTPIEVKFIAAAETPAEWHPPPVKFVPVSVVTEMPRPVVFDTPVEPPPSDRAITAPAEPPPTTSVAATPRLVSSVEYLREPAPRYPPQSRRLREEGLVVLRVLIDEKGAACSIEIENSSGFQRLDHAAREAVERAAFRPYVENGAPRRALVLIPIEFALNRSSA